jgi:poly(3-hydroxyalkanoate) synthetase
MQQLQNSGLERLTLIEWISAKSDSAIQTISSQIALLDRIVDLHSSPVNLIGLCQGGWLSLAYAALFPNKINRLVLVGAPVDFHVGIPFPLSFFYSMAQYSGFIGLTELIDFWSNNFTASTCQILHGRDMRLIWPYSENQTLQMTDALQMPSTHTDTIRKQTIEAYHVWDHRLMDLSAPYFWEIAQCLYRDNQLKCGKLFLLDSQIDLKSVTCPLYLLAGKHDKIVPKEQVLAAAALVGTPSDAIHQSIAPCGHLALFMGNDTLTNYWPNIAKWILARNL